MTPAEKVKTLDGLPVVDTMPVKKQVYMAMTSRMPAHDRPTDQTRDAAVPALPPNMAEQAAITVTSAPATITEKTVATARPQNRETLSSEMPARTAAQGQDTVTALQPSITEQVPTRQPTAQQTQEIITTRPAHRREQPAVATVPATITEKAVATARPQNRETLSSETPVRTTDQTQDIVAALPSNVTEQTAAPTVSTAVTEKTATIPEKVSQPGQLASRTAGVPGSEDKASMATPSNMDRTTKATAIPVEDIRAKTRVERTPLSEQQADIPGQTLVGGTIAREPLGKTHRATPSSVDEKTVAATLSPDEKAVAATFSPTDTVEKPKTETPKEIKWWEKLKTSIWDSPPPSATQPDKKNRKGETEPTPDSTSTERQAQATANMETVIDDRTIPPIPVTQNAMITPPTQIPRIPTTPSLVDTSMQPIQDDIVLTSNIKRTEGPHIISITATDIADARTRLLTQISNDLKKHNIPAQINPQAGTLYLPGLLDFEDDGNNISPKKQQGMHKLANTLAHNLLCFTHTSQRETCTGIPSHIKVDALVVVGNSGPQPVGSAAFHKNWDKANARALKTWITLLKSHPRMNNMRNTHNESLFRMDGFLPPDAGTSKPARRVELRFIMDPPSLASRSNP